MAIKQVDLYSLLLQHHFPYFGKVEEEQRKTAGRCVRLRASRCSSWGSRSSSSSGQCCTQRLGPGQKSHQQWLVWSPAAHLGGFVMLEGAPQGLQVPPALTQALYIPGGPFPIYPQQLALCSDSFLPPAPLTQSGLSPGFTPCLPPQQDDGAPCPGRNGNPFPSFICGGTPEALQSFHTHCSALPFRI